eukprot:g493.t1
MAESEEETVTDNVVVDDSTETESETIAKGKKKRKNKMLDRESLEAFRKKQKRRGVIYLATIPPYMKASKIRNIFSQFDTIHRVYLVPEDKSVYERRKKAGGNKKPKFVEGWVEFDNKRIAKNVALALNNTRVGKKKHTFYYDDLWNIKYLSKFKWTQLTEKLAYEKRVRQKRLETEISQAKRENAFYLKRVDEAKAIEHMEAKRKKKREDGADVEDGEERAHTKRIRRRFFQRRGAQKDTGERASIL